jgi:glycosyltransferase involved in cell wall biosynthesis
MPAVSVILPTYNRARFLDEAFAAIVAQTWQDWELIVVDDGSNDETRAVVERWRPRFSNPFTYVWRENGGAYAARNTGLDHATGEFMAFFDSDDLWLPHHLERCVNAFVANPELDWIFAACRSIDASGSLVQPTTFEINGRSRLFLSLRAENVAGLRIINDPRITEFHLAEGLFAGLQNSVIRRRVFDGHRFWEDYKVVEDFDYLECEGEWEALLAENRLIKDIRPRFNARLTDDKTFPYLAITLREDFPRLVITREPSSPEFKGAKLFGPFNCGHSIDRIDVHGTFIDVCPI